MKINIDFNKIPTWVQNVVGMVGSVWVGGNLVAVIANNTDAGYIGANLVIAALVIAVVFFAFFLRRLVIEVE
jgi:hypothetical protein